MEVSGAREWAEQIGKNRGCWELAVTGSLCSLVAHGPHLGHTTSVSQTQESEGSSAVPVVPLPGWPGSGSNKRSSQCLGCTTRQ